MTEFHRYPADPSAYQTVISDVRATVDPSARLPTWPFRADSGTADYLQFSRVMSAEFDPVLRALVELHGDHTVSFAVLEPSPLEYRRYYGVFPAFKTTPEELSGSYWRFISSELSDDRAGSVEDDADVIALAGSSRRWAVWGERYWDIALILTDSGVRPWTDVGVPFLNADEAWDNLMAPGFGEPQPSRFRDTFLANARARGTRPLE